MRDFEDSTLWRISAFDRERLHTGESAFARIDGPTVLPTTLLADLDRLDADQANNDVLEIVAACMRHREAALLYLHYEELVWPVTLFPRSMLYHSPRDVALASASGLGHLKVMLTEPPGIRPPGHWMLERVGQAGHYRPLAPLLWQLSLEGPRRTLLTEINGTAAYRVVQASTSAQVAAPGALGPAVDRLRRESVSLRTMATWPGLSIERASRLLNGLYLTSNLMVTRAHPAARSQPAHRGLFGFGRSKR
jgi:hypothetical protein